jgi:hypothetical protein
MCPPGHHPYSTECLKSEHVGRNVTPVADLQRALNVQAARSRKLSKARRKNWHRAERSEAYCQKLEEQVDACAELLSNLCGDLAHELEACGRLGEVQRLYDQIWRGNYFGDDDDG